MSDLDSEFGGGLEIGTVVAKEKVIEWEITNFFVVAENETQIRSPRFLFADIGFNLRLYPKSLVEAGFMNLLLVQESKYSMEYKLGFKKVDGSVVHLKKGDLDGNLTWSDNCLFKLSEVQQQISNHSEVLTIVCKLKHKPISSDLHQARMVDIPEHNKLIELDTLFENFRSLFFNKDSCDTTLLVMDEEYKAHKAVLMARSTVFADTSFLHDTLEKQTGGVTIPDCEPKSSGKFLEFLYTGKLEKLSSQNVLHLYETSDKYKVPELKTFCMEFLIRNLTIENLCDIVIIADRYDDSKLLSAAQDFFNENLQECLRTPEWDSLVRNNYRLSKKLLEEMSLKVKVVH